ncbi:MAG: hypothetical protein IJX37_08375 [Oscillospiraceae bacterium]|nr:hypothetical protein [Oscillospiraceae bacterium]
MHQPNENNQVPDTQVQTNIDRHARFTSVRSNLIEWFPTVLFLVCALYVLIYYITGPSIAFLHADCTDSLLWSQAMLESGQILSEDFNYAALLPFGSPLWMVPILRIFGYTLTAHKISMVVFAVLFVAAAFSLFRAMKWNRAVSSLGALMLSLLLSGSAKLREIMWEHVIYYSLGLLLFMLLLNLCLRLFDRMKRWAEGDRSKKNTVCFCLLAVALLLLCIGCGSDGFQMLVLSVIPVLGGCAAVAILDGKSRFLSHSVLGKFLIALIMGVGAVLGLLLLKVLTHNGQISAGYESAYSNWSSMDQWWAHFEGFWISYLRLFGLSINAGDPLFSLDSVFAMVQLIAALLVLVCPLLLLFRYRHIKRESAKLVAWSHCFLLVILMLGYICGSLSAANWRLTPMVGSGIIATLVYLRELLDDKELQGRMAILLSTVLIITAFFHASTILQLPNDLGNNQRYVTISEVLADQGYTKGYATFWNANNTTLLSDSQVQVVAVDVDANGLRKSLYQNSNKWFEDEPGRTSYFLMLSESEYTQFIRSNYWQQLNEQRQLLDEIQIEGFRILVFSGYIFL